MKVRVMIMHLHSMVNTILRPNKVLKSICLQLGIYPQEGPNTTVKSKKRTKELNIFTYLL